MVLAERPFMQVQAPQDHSACLAEAMNNGRVLAGDKVLVSQGAEGGGMILGVKQVLDGDWYAMKRSAIAAGADLGGGSFRLRKGGIGSDGKIRIERRIYLRNSLQQALGDVNWRKFALGDTAGKLKQRKIMQVRFGSLGYL